MAFLPLDAAPYLGAVILAVLALLITSTMLVANKILGEKPREVTQIKGQPVECGVPSEGSGSQQFSVRYYLIGIVFLIFDVEVVFMYPWALVYKSYLAQGFFILNAMALFMLLVLGGYFYLRRRDALNWD